MAQQPPVVSQVPSGGQSIDPREMSKDAIVAAYNASHPVDPSVFRLEFCVEQLLDDLDRKGALSGHNFQDEGYHQTLREQCLARTG